VALARACWFESSPGHLIEASVAYKAIEAFFYTARSGSPIGQSVERPSSGMRLEKFNSGSSSPGVFPVWRSRGHPDARTVVGIVLALDARNAANL
jgi:hypothetical protein